MTDLSNNLQNTNLEQIKEVNENIVIQDDDIDENFDEKPVEINLPAPLSNDELNKVHVLMKSKSNKEITEIITKLMTSQKDSTQVDKMQLESSLLKNLSSSSKRELINMMGTILHQQNKHIVFQNACSLDTVTEQNKKSHDDLRKKLHEKIYMSNKNNLKKMYEKMTESMASLQNDNIDNTDSNQEQNKTKSKKKKNKLNSQKLQSQLMDQMASLLQEQSQEQ